MPAPFKDYYATLGIPSDASPADIKQAFRKLARIHHPDTAPDKSSAEASFKEIHETHGLLTPATTQPALPQAPDDATIHRLHRIEHLRSAYGMELATPQLTLSLFDEIDSLRATLRSLR